ncbi:hypothetical protein [Kribbella speibonae]|uniref:hypothetical protein n=1 Tax=Kribbella speibonae TaxID=1572660 RepID=UPI001EE0DC08|nr:hypothetical protein [Kribbella speibonae]
MKRRMVGWVGGAGLAVAALAPAAAQGSGTSETTGQRAAAACAIWQGSVTAAGQHTSSDVTATTPPAVLDKRTINGSFSPGQIRLSARTTNEPDISGPNLYGYVVIGDALYWSNYFIDATTGQIDPNHQHLLRRVGGGWTPFTMLETSTYETLDGDFSRSVAYAMRENGVLYRWKIVNGTWVSNGSFAGFAAVKSMTLIARTATYDTFLANTRGGGLYTIRIPSSFPLQPVVKQVRTRTWQGFEVLSAMACGRNSTLLLGIDKDTKTGYLYAVGHANGLSTLIESRGKVTGTFDDPVYFRWVPIAPYDVANGD